MNPTLHEADLLEIVPYGEQTVRIGDVILFLPPEGEQLIVHRVISITSEGIRTRGDNNTNNDPWLLQPESITGRAVAAWRGQKNRQIIGACPGWLMAHLARWQRILVQHLFFPLLRPIYRFLLWLNMGHRLLPSRFRARIVIFRANGRNHLRLLLGGRVIGWYDAGQIQWHIQRPFRLFVNLKGFQNFSSL